MHATTVAIDLAKDVFELAFADAGHRVIERKRPKRAVFARVLENREPLHVVMEACGSAHYWGRRFERLGHRVDLLPAQAAVALANKMARRLWARTSPHELRSRSRQRATGACYTLNLSLCVSPSRVAPSLTVMAKRVGPRNEQADNSVGPRGRLNEWLRSADSMMARANQAHPRPYRRLQPIRFAKIRTKLCYLTEESIHA